MEIERLPVVVVVSVPLVDLVVVVVDLAAVVTVGLGKKADRQDVAVVTVALHYS